MHTIEIKHSQGVYLVHIAHALQDVIDAALKPDRSTTTNNPSNNSSNIDKTCIITNAILAKTHAKQIQQLKEAFAAEPDILTIEDGEYTKNCAQAEILWRQLAQKRFSRSSRLIAYGGGVITDLVGFVAASYMRGIDYLSVPTSLLAQTDAALGGKTGVNLPEGKNLVGSFHHPSCVLIATSLLDSLPNTEIINGYAEIIKHALLADEDFFCFLEEHLPAATTGKPPLPKQPQLTKILHRSCSIKAKIVSMDERERMDKQPKRMLLNLGHTFGHALEANAQYQAMSHGQAVSIGICLAATISRQLGHLTRQEVERICKLLGAVGLPTQIPRQIKNDSLVKFILSDKKSHNAKVHLILLRSLGQAYVSPLFPADEIKEMLRLARLQ